MSLLAGRPNDFTLMETIDLLDTYRPLPGKGDEICFSSFLAKDVYKRQELVADELPFCTTARRQP